jgi:hypothetical protein
MVRSRGVAAPVICRNRTAIAIGHAELHVSVHGNRSDQSPSRELAGKRCCAAINPRFQCSATHTDPALVSLELDVYWIVQAGLDPAVFLRQHSDRVKLLNPDDRLPGFPTSYITDADSVHSTELGKGTIARPVLLRQAGEQDIRYAFLDYDTSSGRILDSLGQSFTYLKTLPDRPRRHRELRNKISQYEGTQAD